MAGEVLTCVQFDEVTSTCTVEAWLPQKSLLPELAVADAVLLASLIVGNWALAYAFRRVEQVIRQ